jgi:hypothetical protein
MNLRSVRGAALPETALSLTVMLAVLVGGLRLAIVGYEQVAVDGAAFYDAHETGIKTTYSAIASGLDPTAATEQVYPRSSSPSVTINATAPQPAPTVNVATQYGFDQTTNRHGGTSMIQPLQQMSMVTNSSVDSLSPWTGGSVLSVTGYGVDVSYLETGVHANVDGANFNGASGTSTAVEYFSDGENTPPYFGGFNYMQVCPYTDSTTSYWNSCPTETGFRALGLAEYLTTDNWSRPDPGESIVGTGPNSGSVFWETVFHHDVYARISQALPADINPGNDQKLAQEVLDWTGANAASYNVACPPFTGACNADIQIVYSWDVSRAAGTPPSGYVPGEYPLTPGAGYPAQ